MIELNFKGCKTKADVEKVFDKKEDELAEDINRIGKLRILFFEDNNKIKKGVIKK